MKLIVFTDLDATLLDHETYSFEAARPALQRLRELGCPVVFVTSKTRAEVEVLRSDLAIGGPFITENGGGVFFPTGFGAEALPGAKRAGDFIVVVLGRPYVEARAFIESHRERFAIEGFGDMSHERIAELTGLSVENAERAAQREFTEPFLLADPESLGSLTRLAEEQGFAITTGGRMYHLIGENQDKGRGVMIVTHFFQRQLGPQVRTVGLGDSPNDLPMLQAVDLPVVIPRPSGHALALERSDVTIAGQAGSRGWNEAVTQLLARLYSSGS